MNEDKITLVSPRRLSAGTVAIAAAVILGGAVLGVATTSEAAATATGPACGPPTPTLTVQGSGQASGSPDLLDFGVQVSVNASSARDTLSQDKATTSSVVGAIEAAGVNSSDIQTSDLSINPNYGYANGHPIITGYGVTNGLDVKVRRLSDAGSVIDAAANAGGNALSVGSLTFVRSDPRVLEDRARNDAVGQAVTHAGAMARAAGQRLVRCARSSTTRTWIRSRSAQVWPGSPTPPPRCPSSREHSRRAPR